MGDDGFGCCGGSDTVPQHHTSDCPTHPWTDRPGENCLLGTCHHVAALTAARAAGYAEGRAAERADMLAFVEDACRLGTQGDALLRALMAKGKHEGAASIVAKKGTP